MCSDWANALEFELKMKEQSGKKELYFEYQGKSYWMAPIEILKSVTLLYHWGSETSINKKIETSLKIHSGILSPHDFKDVLDHNGSQESGIYTSMDGWDSSDYGTHLMIIQVPDDAPVVNWSLIRSFPRSHPELGIPVSELSDYRSKLDQKLLSIGVLATYYGADSIDSNQAGDSAEGYHYVAVKSPILTQQMKVADSNDILKLIHTSHPPKDESDGIERLLRLANLKSILPHEIEWNWEHIPLTRKLILGSSLNLEEKQNLISNLRHSVFWKGADETGLKSVAVPKNQLALKLAENLFDDQQALLFLMNLNRANLINKRPLDNLLSLTQGFPRLSTLAQEKSEFFNQTLNLMKAEKEDLWLPATNERIYRSLLLDSNWEVQASAANLLLPKWIHPLFLTDKLSTQQREEFKNLMQQEQSNDRAYNQEIIHRLKVYFPALKDLFLAKNSDGQSTIEEHCLAVMELFDEQRKFYEVSLKDIATSDLLSFQHQCGFIKTLLALHDIGKPFGRRDQHQNTDPIVNYVLMELRFTPSEIQFARAFLETDLLGEMMMSSTDEELDLRTVIDDAFSELQSQARKANIPTRDFYLILCNFYISDANFYSYISKRFQKEQETGKIIPKNERSLAAWKELETRVLTLP